MNAILSHQSVIRPLFDGLISKRCPPGFYVKFSYTDAKLKSYLFNKQTKTRKQQDAIVKKMNAVSEIYKSYCRIHQARAH